ncbi:hypothetical protein SAY87_006280 [Trapa incisa]|uniref:Uncharacterized protein n=1 Tax=Trapa incisa TaxID=236973 RepID=A0AAN7PYT6_9MYRT|nr:hypothetical protein SAY87_006280 [Trapa incisa]
MEAFVKLAKKKTKRKDLDQVNDDFSDFSLSSPARKIRRLDAELPPIVEDDDIEYPMSTEQPGPEVRPAGTSLMIEELPPPSSPINEERALVLFKPVRSPVLQQQSPSILSVSVDADWISEFKNRNLWGSLSGSERSLEDDAGPADSNRNRCMAVVPWVANQLSSSTEPLAETAEEMETEETEGAMMEIEQSTADGTSQQPPNHQYGDMKDSNSSSLPQWQHCLSLTPQFPPATSSPIVWYR